MVTESFFSEFQMERLRDGYYLSRDEFDAKWADYDARIWG